MNDILAIIQELIKILFAHGITWASLGFFIGALIIWLLKKPIVRAFLLKYKEYIRPVILELLKIMDEIEKNMKMAEGQDKEAAVLRTFESRLNDPKVKSITKDSTKWMSWLGGVSFVVKYILYPAIKLFRK